MTRKAWIVLYAGVGLGAALLLPLAVLARRTPTANPKATADTSSSAVRVETVEVSRQDWKRVSESVPAELLPYEKTDLYAKIPGFVKEMRVDYGDPVKKDQVLAVLWVPELEQEYEQKKALVAQAEAAIKQAREAVTVAEKSYNSAVEQVKVAEANRQVLLARQKRTHSQAQRLERVGSAVMDRENIDEAQLGYATAKAGVTEAEAKITAAQAMRDEAKAKWNKTLADLQAAEANLQAAKADQDRVAALLLYTKVQAPYDGVVVKRYQHTGAFLNRTNILEQALLTVVRTDLVRVIVDVPEKDVRYLDKDDRVSVTLDALPGKKFEWKITRLAPVLGAGKKARVEVDVDNPGGTLYPGMYGHTAVILEERSGSLTLPANCLRNDDKGTFVWLAIDGKATRRRVTVGLTEGEKAEIVSGLDGSEEIVRSNTVALQEGQAIRTYRVQPTR